MSQNRNSDAAALIARIAAIAGPVPGLLAEDEATVVIFYNRVPIRRTFLRACFRKGLVTGYDFNRLKEKPDLLRVLCQGTTSVVPKGPDGAEGFSP